MPKSTPFRLNRSGMLLALISAAFAGGAGAAAGRVDFVSGGVTVSGTDGRTQPLARGAELDTGHTVRTTDGRAQIRFTDGSYVSLQPNTEFAIKDYRFEGKTDGTESGLFALARGAMRTVTGLIGRVNRNRYRITTPTATVGIRGTGGVIQVLNDGSTLVIGTSGIWSLSNPSGSIDVPAGVSGLAPSAPDSPPQQSSQAPEAGPAPIPVEVVFEQGEQVDATGNPIIPVVSTLPALTPLVSGSGYAAAAAFMWSGNSALQADSNASATFNTAGQMMDVTFSDGQIFKLDPLTGAHADFGTDGVLAWGRWTGDVSGLYNCDGLCNFNEFFNDNQGFHYVIGMPTPSMPTSGTASYSLLGATRPTYVDGTALPGTMSGNLSVDFGRLTVGMNLNVGIDGKGYAIGGSAPISGSTFTGFSGQGALTVSGTNGGCSSGCNAAVQGFFAGTSAERAGLGYHIGDFLTGKDIVGAAAFKKQ